MADESNWEEMSVYNESDTDTVFISSDTSDTDFDDAPTRSPEMVPTLQDTASDEPEPEPSPLVIDISSDSDDEERLRGAVTPPIPRSKNYEERLKQPSAVEILSKDNQEVPEGARAEEIEKTDNACEELQINPHDVLASWERLPSPFPRKLYTEHYLFADPSDSDGFPEAFPYYRRRRRNNADVSSAHGDLSSDPTRLIRRDDNGSARTRSYYRRPRMRVQGENSSSS